MLQWKRQNSQYQTFRCDVEVMDGVEAGGWAMERTREGVDSGLWRGRIEEWMDMDSAVEDCANVHYSR